MSTALRLPPGVSACCQGQAFAPYLFETQYKRNTNAWRIRI